MNILNNPVFKVRFIIASDNIVSDNIVNDNIHIILNNTVLCII